MHADARLLPLLIPKLGGLPLQQLSGTRTLSLQRGTISEKRDGFSAE